MKLNFSQTKKLKTLQKLMPLWLATFFLLALFPYYIGQKIILGGEANYILNYSNELHMLLSTWIDRFGTGIPNLITMGAGLPLHLQSLLDNWFENKAIPNFFLIFSLYYFSSLGMYLALSELKVKPPLASLIAIFYVINPFTITWMDMLNQWNNFATAAMPFLLWVILKNYRNNIRLFFFYGLTSALMSQAYTNIPLNVVVNLSAIISIFVAAYHHHQKFELKTLVSKILLINLSFILFNAWWLFPSFYFAAYAQSIYPVAFAEDWLIETLNHVASPLAKGMSFNLITPSYDSTFAGYWHSSILGKILSIIPIIIILITVFLLPGYAEHQSAVLLTGFTFLSILFLIKGPLPPFGEVFTFLFKYFPFFNIFKTPFVKFGILYYFLLSILLGVLLNNVPTIKSISLTTCFSVYLVYCLIPVFSGNLIQELNVKSVGKVSRLYSDTPDYISARAYINNSRLNARSLSIPGMGNYQHLLKTTGGGYYSGIDPLLANTNKPRLTSYEAEVIYLNLNSTKFFQLIGFFNTGPIVLNENTIPWFGNVGPDHKSWKQRLLDTNHKSFGNLIIWENMGNFKPLLHTSSAPWMVLKN